MKKRQVDHILRAAGEITGEKEFIIIGSQALHGKFPDAPDTIVRSAEVHLIAKKIADRTEWLNAIGADFRVTANPDIQILRLPGAPPPTGL